MDFSDREQRRIFFEAHAGLPRQSAGSDASTLRALDMVAAFVPPAPLIADMACGPGSSALPLARAMPDACILALDVNQSFLDELTERMAMQGLVDRIFPRLADMAAPIPEAGMLDMIWCEGGIYNIGVGAGLTAWRDALKPNGLVVFNEPIWLVDLDKRSAEVRAFWEGYSAMTDAIGVEQAIEAAGYELLGAFDLPESDWWDDYYAPMQRNLAKLEAKYRGETAVAGPIEHSRTEIDMRQRFAASYNYRFFAVKLA